MRSVMNSKLRQKYQGSCHCGSIKFEISTEIPELTTCDCSICSRKNALMVKVHQDEFLLINGVQYLTEYQFNTKIAKHYFCKICGIYPFHRKRVTPDYFGINVHCLEEFDSTGIPIRATDGKGIS